MAVTPEWRFQLSERRRRRRSGRAEQMELTSPCLCRARLPSASNSLRTSFTFKLQSVKGEGKKGVGGADKQAHMETL